jgi:hypothetical protein
MRHLAIGIVVVVAIGLAGWAATGGSGDQEREGVVIAGSSGNSANAAPADAKPEDQSTSRPAATAAVSTKPAEASPVDDAMAAMRVAADAKKHLFVFVQGKAQDEPTRTARKKFDAALARLGDKAQSFTVNRDAASEREFVEQFGLKAAPMPVILVLAPNGVVAGGFLGSQVSGQQLVESLAGPAKQKCLKALQARKLVLLCAQNAGTKSNDAAMKGVNAFKADPRFAEFTEVVLIDPADEGEKAFLAQLQIGPKVTEATTLMLAPPGSVLSTVTGATEKDALIAALQRASSGCGTSGCAPSGCGPR